MLYSKKLQALMASTATLFTLSINAGMAMDPAKDPDPSHPPVRPPASTSASESASTSGSAAAPAPAPAPAPTPAPESAPTPGSAAAPAPTPKPESASTSGSAAAPAPTPKPESAPTPASAPAPAPTPAPDSVPASASAAAPAPAPAPAPTPAPADTTGAGAPLAAKPGLDPEHLASPKTPAPSSAVNKLATENTLLQDLLRAKCAELSEAAATITALTDAVERLRTELDAVRKVQVSKEKQIEKQKKADDKVAASVVDNKAPEAARPAGDPYGLAKERADKVLAAGAVGAKK